MYGASWLPLESIFIVVFVGEASLETGTSLLILAARTNINNRIAMGFVRLNLCADEELLSYNSNLSSLRRIGCDQG